MTSMAALKLLGRMVSLTLRPYWRLTRGLTLGAQGIVVDPEGQILLVRHGYRPGWFFPGGGVERGETAEEALVRELEEEAGVLVEGTPVLFGLYANLPKFPGDHIAVFLVQNWTQPETPRPSAEIAEARFFARDALPDDINSGTRRRLAELYEGAAPQSVW